MSKQILVIDDERQHLELLDRALSRKGYTVFTSTDPDEAFRILREQDISLVLLDIRMPKKSGFELYREFENYRQVPVLFVTGYPEEFAQESTEVVEMWKRQFSQGMTDILYKPFEIPTLYEKVESLIGPST